MWCLKAPSHHLYHNFGGRQEAPKMLLLWLSMSLVAFSPVSLVESRTTPSNNNNDMATTSTTTTPMPSTSRPKILTAPNISRYTGCGVNRYSNQLPLTERIVGGNSSYEGEFPWQVSIRLTHPHAGKVGHWCGGVLIDPSWVITAAHCIINPLFMLPQAKHWEVRVGEHHQKMEDGYERTYDVAEVFHYPLYKGYDNDIALMKLAQPVEVSEFVKPICLPPTQYTEFFDKECVASGWGKLDHNKKGSDILQKVRIKVFNNSLCQQAYYSKFKIAIKSWHLCAGTDDEKGGKGTCHGDSGGPLQCKVLGTWYLAGITSFGSGCAKPGFPDVYTRITYFMDWINRLGFLY